MKESKELDRHNCKKLLTEFINDHLAGDIEKLHHFNFTQLINCKKYGASKHGFDSDNAKLANTIYYLIWEKKLPELELKEIGTGKKYRGDTLNTFNTLFKGIDKFCPDKEFLSNVKEFKSKYVSIGNFMLMPNVSILAGKATRTINTYRGTNSWRDYFDRFLWELNVFYSTNGECDKSLSDLIESNRFYFNEINTIERFINVNCLGSYLDTSGKIKVFFDPYLYHWKYKKITDEVKDFYFQFSKKYMKEASKIIDNRSTIMVSHLKDALDN